VLGYASHRKVIFLNSRKLAGEYLRHSGLTYEEFLRGSTVRAFAVPKIKTGERIATLTVSADPKNRTWQLEELKGPGMLMSVQN
jgi:hypothetical protein